MPETSLISESLGLMAIGMGTVFCFLLVLVLMLRAMSWLAQRLSGAPMALPTATGITAPAAGQADQQRLVAAISAAITYYRSRRGP